ncbi:hypothetical protein [Sulfurisphaera javensis]
MNIEINYIELYLTFLEPNGFGISTSVIIPPYTIPTQEQVYG